MLWIPRGLMGLVIVGMLVACAGPGAQRPLASVPATGSHAEPKLNPTPKFNPTPALLPPSTSNPAQNAHASPEHLPARWQRVAWADLPGLQGDRLHEAWNALLKNCERPPPVFAPLCPQVRALSIASASEQHDWLQRSFAPYRVLSANGAQDGLLTGYFEPQFEASRAATADFTVPLYALPTGLAQRRPWFTRQEADTRPEARAALGGKVIAFLADPVDALVLQIQGSGRLRIVEADGSERLVRLSYAGSNDQPYRSVGKWLLDQGLTRDGSWAGVKDWLLHNPLRAQELLWVNPRLVFFREDALSPFEAAFGPRGSQGVPLTPGRSVAVDPRSMPMGTLVWISTSGPLLKASKLVLAQDTGAAISGALRADYFTGWGQEAADLAARLKQPVQMWALWPTGAARPRSP